MYTLFDYQEDAIDQVTDFFTHGGHSVVLSLPTGTGKSLVAVEFIKRMREMSKPVYFLTASTNLLWQFSEHLEEFDFRHGIIKSGCPTLNYRIQVASVQSLMSRIESIDEPGAIVLEEAHHAASPQFLKALERWPNAWVLGLTASPRRLDGKPLSMFEKIICPHQVRWYIDNYYLSDYDYYVPADLDTSKLHHKMGDFSKAEIDEQARSDHARVGNFVKHYRERCNGLPGIAFGTSIADAENIALSFRENGFDMMALHSKMDGSARDALDDAREGRLKLMSTCDLIGEGVDVKGITALLDGRPTESLVVAVQHWGRALRVKYGDGFDLHTREGRRAAIEAGGKGRAQILDFSSNYARHGLPDDDREWTLSGACKEKTGSKYKRCPNCQRPVPSFMSVCPSCGYEFPKPVETAREPEEVEGQLVPISEFKPEDRNNLVLKIARGASTYKQALKIAKECGANAGAAWYTWTKVLGKGIGDGTRRY